MTTQTSKKTLFQALVAAQKNFEAASKTSNNPHFRSKYAALDVCVDAVKDALNAEGIYLLQRTHECDLGVKIETIFIHESGEQLSGGVLHVPASKHDAQGYGSALTYARRYSLLAACGIAPEDDDGNAASKPTVKISPDDISNKLEQFKTEIETATNTDQIKKALTPVREWAKLYNLQAFHKQVTDLATEQANKLTEANNG